MTGAPDHDDLLGQAAPWVLGALPDAEAAAYAEHLRGCARCRAEVAELQVVADALPLAAPEAEPPADLKDRIMAVAVRESAAPAARPARRRWWAGATRGRTLAVAAALALVGIGVAIGVAAAGGGGPAPVTRRASVDAARLAGASAELVQTGATAVLRVRGMPAPAPGRVYQVWVQRGGAAPAPDVVFTVDRAGRGSAALRGDVRGARAVLVTSEPVGGSRAPTAPPVMRVTPA